MEKRKPTGRPLNIYDLYDKSGKYIISGTARELSERLGVVREEIYQSARGHISWVGGKYKAIKPSMSDTMTVEEAVSRMELLRAEIAETLTEEERAAFRIVLNAAIKNDYMGGQT